MIVLITGGASGLGEAITCKIASNSADTVYFTYSKSDSNAKNITKKFPNAISVKCDFGNLTEVNDLCDKIDKMGVDVLINNAYAGSFLETYFHKLNVDSFAAGFEKNIIPTIKITQSAILCFRKKKFGKIITILTTALVNTPPIGSSIYAANKAYVQELTKIWAVENIKYNITSNTVSPSIMLTNMTSSMDERVIEQIKESHPLKKILTCDEVAESVSFLTNSTQQINGLNIILNAGENIK